MRHVYLFVFARFSAIVTCTADSAKPRLIRGMDSGTPVANGTFSRIPDWGACYV